MIHIREFICQLCKVKRNGIWIGNTYSLKRHIYYCLDCTGFKTNEVIEDTEKLDKEIDTN